MPGQAIFDRDDKVSLNLARYKKSGKEFEIVVDADKAVEFKEGKSVALSDVLQSEHVYSDAKKGLVASSTDLKGVFETDDALEVAKKILAHGEIQLTADYRKKLRERKLKQIVEMIHRNGVDPSTHLPHPLTRIENAIDEARVKIDEFKKAEEQLPEVIRQLRPILAISFEVNEIAVKIPAEYAVKAYSTVKGNAKILNEQWQKDGSWVCVVEIAAGLREDFFNKVNKITKGNVETKILKTR